MTTSVSNDLPGWIVPGAEVVLYNVGGAGTSPNVRRTRIARVATASFTVEADREPRFPIDKPRARQGGTWGWTRHVVPLDSPEARRQLGGERLRQATAAADTAYNHWLHRRSPETCAALVSALQLVQAAAELVEKDSTP